MLDGRQFCDEWDQSFYLYQNKITDFYQSGWAGVGGDMGEGQRLSLFLLYENNETVL